MFSPRATVLILSVFLLPACVSSGDSREEANRDQLEAFIRLQEKQTRIEEFALSFPSVDAVTAYLRTGSVIVKMFLKPGKRLTAAQQEDLNAFITKMTGIPRESITLAVPESAYPDLRRDE